LYTLVFVNTKYQLEVFKDLSNDWSEDNLVLVGPAELGAEIESSEAFAGTVILFDKINSSMGFFQSRKLLHDFNRRLEFLKGRPADFYLANDDHILAQFLVRHVRVRDISLFEDGLGSYVRHRPMMLDMGVKGFLSKLKKIIYFAPYYRSFLRFGDNFKASRCYSYNQGCFQGQRSADRVLIRRRPQASLTVNDYPDDAVFFVGQPLVEAGFISRDDYRGVLLEVGKRFSSGSVIFYKPHPSETDFSKIPKNYFLVSKSEMVLEQEIDALRSRISVLGFYSTVLLNCSSSENVVSVKSIRSIKINVPDRYYEPLKNSGCCIVDI